MSDFSEKRKQALAACDKVINGIEDGTITVSSSLLLCKKIARLVNDLEGQEWLTYEYAGYPKKNDGHIVNSAWQIAKNHGRNYISQDKDGNNKEYIFLQLCSELETSIQSAKASLGNFSTKGISVSGDYALLATDRMMSTIARNTGTLLNSIQDNERRLGILKAQYYDYAVRWQIELRFGNAAKTIFEEYQERVDLEFSSFPSSILHKLSAIEDLMEDGNPERYAQILTSCRRLWSETATLLFEDVLPNHTNKTFITKSGRTIDISGDHVNNKLSAVIETLQSKTVKNTLVGSEIIYLIDWMEQINHRQNSGVHSDVKREEAMQCIIHTYVALGDILSLKKSVQQEQNSYCET